MTIGIHSRKEKQVVVVRLEGHLTMDSDTRLHDEIKRLLETGARRVLVDLSGVEYVDSHGLGQMVACHNALHSQGGRVRFVGVSQKLRRLLEMTRLPRILQFDPDLATGLSKLGSP